MRIERIAIRGLASLRDPQPIIDLTAPEFVGAGLIAVTGPTGAGKSTVFDAVCLPLFDATPRLVGRGADPRELLSRGAASARVEIVLRLDDGSRLLASWSANRARDRLDGTLQPSQLEIRDAATGAVLAAGKRDVLALVQDRLGLSFDQFRAVAMLSQGEFARFIHDPPAEKAGLLEKLTGTQLYAALSRRAHQRHARLQRELATHEARLGGIIVLDAGVAEAHAGEITSLGVVIADAGAELVALRQDLARWQALDAAVALVCRATQASAVAAAALPAAEANATATVLACGAAVARLALGIAEAEQAAVAAENELRLADERLAAAGDVASLAASAERGEQAAVLAEQEVRDGPALATIAAQAASAASAAAEATAVLAAAGAAHARQREARDALVQAARIAAFRHLLKDGEPCPLCGATGHPGTVHDAGLLGSAETLLAGLAAAETEALRRHAQAIEAHRRLSTAHAAAASAATARRAAWERLRAQQPGLPEAPGDAEALRAEVASLRQRLTACAAALAARDRAVHTHRAAERRLAGLRLALAPHRDLPAAAPGAVTADAAAAHLPELARRHAAAATALREAQEAVERTGQALADAVAAEAAARQELPGDQADAAALTGRIATIEAARAAALERRATLQAALDADAAARRSQAEGVAARELLLTAMRPWADLDAMIGHSDGERFRQVAQALVLDQLLVLANRRLVAIAPRYALARLRPDSDPHSLALAVLDHDQADECRPVATLSGGETFLASLALALALADLKRGRLRLGTLFIDEGFAALDADTLDQAMGVLERLQAEQGTQILLISHVGAMQERIRHQIRVVPLGAGVSRLRLLAPEGEVASTLAPDAERPAIAAPEPPTPADLAAVLDTLAGGPASTRSLRLALGWEALRFNRAVQHLLEAGRVLRPPGSKSLALAGV